MKNKNYRLLSLLLALPLFLASCGGNTPSDSNTGSGGNGKVTSVTINEPSETTVLDGTRTSLKAVVTGADDVSQKVTWETSNKAVATVTNGVVNFLKVSEETKVTITATAVDDNKFSDSVEFTVKHSPFDLRNSRGSPDTSLFFEDGSFVIEDPQDVALVYADVHDTRWYVQATIQLDSFLPTDQYPKFGIMASERDDGMWTYEQSHQFFYYVDSYSSAQSWNVLNVVTEDNDLVNWNWGSQISAATASPSIRKGEPFKLGLLRDGNQYYQFYGEATDVTLDVVGSFEYDSFDNQPNYVWVGGWAAGVVVSDPIWAVGSDIDAMYEIPEGISLKATEETIYLGNSYQIEVTTEGLWDKNKLTFSSSNEDIATVNAKGLVTANSENPGTAIITVGLQGTELSASFTLNVTDDLLYRVDLDGEMDDAIWTEKVRINSYLLKKNDTNYIQIYGAKNSRGLYLFFDYTVDAIKNAGPGWYQKDNVEFRLAGENRIRSGQYWISALNGGSFVSVGDSNKAEQVYYKPLSLGNDNLYHGAFEAFVPYGDDGLIKGEVTYICFGFSPASDWYAGYNWGDTGNPFPANTLNVTTDGFAHDNTSCFEQHAYGSWITDVAETCISVGSAHRVCSFCGHVDTKVLEIDPNAHLFDYEHAVISVTPTCNTTGLGTAICTLCGAEENTVLPYDFTNHTDADYVGGTHLYCYDCGIGNHLNNVAGDIYEHNYVGWDNKANWYDIGVYSGDFSIEFEFNMQGCLGVEPDCPPADCCWRTTLPILYKEGWESNAATGNRVDHVFRMDWFGWDDGAFTTEVFNGSMPAGFDWTTNYQAFSNMDVELTITKIGARVTLDWVWHCKASGVYQDLSFVYNQSCTLVDGSKVGVALTAEWCNMTITKVSFTRG